MTQTPHLSTAELTLPQEAARTSDVDVVVRHTGRDPHVAHALRLHVRVRVAHLVAVALPEVILIVGQVVAADVALPDHPALLVATADDFHVAVAARLGSRGSKRRRIRCGTRRETGCNCCNGLNIAKYFFLSFKRCQKSK